MFSFGFSEEGPPFAGWKEQNENSRFSQLYEMHTKNCSQNWNRRSHYSRVDLMAFLPWNHALVSMELAGPASLVLLAPFFLSFIWGFPAFQQNTGSFRLGSSRRWEACCPVSSAAPHVFAEAPCPGKTSHDAFLCYLIRSWTEVGLTPGYSEGWLSDVSGRNGRVHWLTNRQRILLTW